MAASWQTRWCVATLLVGMPACSGGHAEPRVTPSVWGRSTSPEQVRQDVEAAYRATWMDMAAAAKTADYPSPRLARHASGDALSTLVKALYDVKQRGMGRQGRAAASAAGDLADAVAGRMGGDGRRLFR